ncbi:metallophosphoesterase [Psychrobacter sanguinis]|uniref:3',5'-cyclic-nucleotide phosphodiesterase n=1 Tax=Psychrobacter sanguinis TaxID=861445 RepID=A0A844LY77_9GAMM|nr:metallophosphoesterase [Psychrobacter sanguinis]MUG31636.1 3',5'-cyclic-nucleotide phosphodiesterase [Psychrobacter sanguinis]
MAPLPHSVSPRHTQVADNGRLSEPTDYHPPTEISTDDGTVNILQLTDLHLYFDTPKATHEQDIDKDLAHQTITGICQNNSAKRGNPHSADAINHSVTPVIHNYASFEACLTQALSEDVRCDLIVVTGDLVSEIHPQLYQHLYQRLHQSGIPFACIAGNHDVTDEIGKDLPFEQRSFEPHEPDSRLLSRYSMKLNGWEILFINSSVPGQIFGRIGNKNLYWLSQKLANSHHPVIIAMHHHLLPMHSAWIDAHITQDATEFWQTVAPFNALKAVVGGHVHQSSTRSYQGVQLYSTPSTGYQFKPGCDDFTLDDEAKPGYRWLSLKANGTLQSWVVRLEDNAG